MQGEVKKQSKFIKYGGGFLAAIFLLALIGVLAGPKSRAPVTSPLQPALAPQGTQINAAEVPISDFQKSFVAVIDEVRAKYQGTDNQLARSALVTERHEKFEKLKGDPRKIKDWVGRIEHLGTTGDGKAYVSITLTDNVTFTTYSVDFADTQDHTLISQTSPIYKSLMAMNEGDRVKFSGRLKRTIDITEAGKMVDPNFLFVFSDISKI